MTQPPIHVIRMGLIKASVWRNNTKSGTRHTITICRLFRNGDVWQESTRFGRDDLLLLSKVLDHVHSWIVLSNQDANQLKTGDAHEL